MIISLVDTNERILKTFIIVKKQLKISMEESVAVYFRRSTENTMAKTLRSYSEILSNP